MFPQVSTAGSNCMLKMMWPKWTWILLTLSLGLALSLSLSSAPRRQIVSSLSSYWLIFHPECFMQLWVLSFPSSLFPLPSAPSNLPGTTQHISLRQYCPKWRDLHPPRISQRGVSTSSFWDAKDALKASLSLCYVYHHQPAIFRGMAFSLRLGLSLWRFTGGWRLSLTFCPSD